VFGCAKVRYRGLEKKAGRLFVACSLANTLMLRRRLLRA
jgi:IS5 family transposase